MTGTIELDYQEVLDLYSCINLALETTDPDWHKSKNQIERLEALKEKLLQTDVSEHDGS